MEFKTEQVEKYGALVHRHSEMDALRGTQCLCFNCAKTSGCPIAAKGLQLCRDHNIAFAVTRCPEFQLLSKEIA